MTRAVIFDIDGTLVDSVDLHAHAWREAFAHFGREIPFADVRSQIGKGGDQLVPVFLSPKEMETFGEALIEYRSALYKRDYLPKVAAFPGVRPLFQRLLADGKEVALASSAKGDELATYKKVAGIDDLVQTEISADDARRSKPHPDVFSVALGRLKERPPASEVRVVGDSPYDAQAAGKLDLPTVGVLCGGFPEDWLRAAGCRDIFRDPTDLLARYGDWI
jgi:phosphoglycolate phosphatase-like HAD superfamily hydrolase